jgi:hypothetical protein
VEERFLSYLLVPIFILAAFGIKKLTAETPLPQWIASTTYSAALLAAGMLVFAVFALRHARLPQEANREAAGTIAAALKETQRPVVFNTHDPHDVLYYLHGVHALTPSHRHVERIICSPEARRTGVIFVEQPFGVRTVDTDCLEHNGARVRVWRQWDRGLSISVWVLPPARPSA